MSKFIGTPKSLKQAIANGTLSAFQEYAKHNQHGAMACHWDSELAKEHVYQHVKDFLSQKITAAAYTDNDEINAAMLELFKKLVA